MNELISCIKDIIISLAALSAAIVAIYGITSWRRELKGKANFETARGLIRATYKLRDEIASCRSPLINAYEFPESYDGLKNSTSEKEAQAYAHVYKNRWEPVWEAIQEFDSNTLEAEALWGNEIKEKTDELRQCVKEINIAIDAIISNKASGNRDFEADREFGKSMRNMVHASSSDEKNEISKRIKKSIISIEEIIRPHLKRG